MPKMQQCTVEFKDQAVRFVFESIKPTELREGRRIVSWPDVGRHRGIKRWWTHWACERRCGA